MPSIQVEYKSLLTIALHSDAIYGSWCKYICFTYHMTGLFHVLLIFHNIVYMFYTYSNISKTLRRTQNSRHFADDIFECIYLNESFWISKHICVTRPQLTKRHFQPSINQQVIYIHQYFSKYVWSGGHNQNSWRWIARHNIRTLQLAGVKITTTVHNVC